LVSEADYAPARRTAAVRTQWMTLYYYSTVDIYKSLGQLAIEKLTPNTKLGPVTSSKYPTNIKTQVRVIKIKSSYKKF